MEMNKMKKYQRIEDIIWNNDIPMEERKEAFEMYKNATTTYKEFCGMLSDGLTPALSLTKYQMLQVNEFLNRQKDPTIEPPYDPAKEETKIIYGGCWMH